MRNRRASKSNSLPLQIRIPKKPPRLQKILPLLTPLLFQNQLPLLKSCRLWRNSQRFCRKRKPHPLLRQHPFLLAPLQSQPSQNLRNRPPHRLENQAPAPTLSALRGAVHRMSRHRKPPFQNDRRSFIPPNPAKPAKKEQSFSASRSMPAAGPPMWSSSKPAAFRDSTVPPLRAPGVAESETPKPV